MTNSRKKTVFAILLGLTLATVAAAKDQITADHTLVDELLFLSLPTDVALGADGLVYVVDSGNHQVAVFDADGARISSLKMLGDDDGQLNGPVGIGVGKKGDVYVADRGNQRVVMFDAKGRLGRVIDLEDDGEKATPIDVAVSPTGDELFITTNNTHRVLVYSSRGDFLRAWGGEGEDDGQFRYPATIDVDRAGNVYVVDVLNARVQKFDAAGTHLQTIGKLGGKAGTFYRPKGVAVDDVGRIYVSDSFLGVVQVFDAAGAFLYVLGEQGAATVFETPVGLAASDGRLYLARMLAGNVAILELQPPAIGEAE